MICLIMIIKHIIMIMIFFNPWWIYVFLQADKNTETSDNNKEPAAETVQRRRRLNPEVVPGNPKFLTRTGTSLVS